MSGDELRVVLEQHGYSGREAARKLGKHERTVYNWFSQDKIKKRVLSYIAEGLDIPANDFTSATRSETIAADPETLYSISTHQGRNLQNILKQRGMSISAFSKGMKVSRATAYAHFKDKELPTGLLLEAAHLLNIPVAQIKGRGDGQKGFEKDIYLMLEKIKSQLDRIENSMPIAS